MRLLQTYFQDLSSYLRTGPPLLLVVSNIDMDPAAPDINRICSVAGCDTDSFTTR